jgi:ER lumen protein retaining receptor
MTSVYARTREREKAWKFGLYCLAGPIVVAPIWYLIFKQWVLGHNTFLKVSSRS